MNVLMPLPKARFFNALGKPLSSGKVYTYQSGTTTPLQTYTDATGLTQNANPVVLDAAGQADIWLATGQAYRIMVQDSTGATLSTTDSVTGLATTISEGLAADSTVAYSATPTFTALAQNQLFRITLTGNVTSSTLPMSGISVPATVTFEITQDSSGSHTFAWPANVVGANVISATANATTIQTFIWDGTYANSVAPALVNGVGPAVPAVTIKKGSGTGVAYTTSSASYVDVDGTNLTYTVTIPTGWKLLIYAQALMYISTAQASEQLSLYDSATLLESGTAPAAVGPGYANTVSLSWVINGDNASHTIKLRYKTGNAADAANISNTATALPVMVFTLTPSS